jgi:hypothetical protein
LAVGFKTRYRATLRCRLLLEHRYILLFDLLLGLRCGLGGTRL